MGWEGVWVVGILFVGLFVLIWTLVRSEVCPKCKAKSGLQRTGEIRNQNFFSAGEEKWKCIECSHELWRKRDSGIIGGGG